MRRDERLAHYLFQGLAENIKEKSPHVKNSTCGCCNLDRHRPQSVLNSTDSHASCFSSTNLCHVEAIPPEQRLYEHHVSCQPGAQHAGPTTISHLQTSELGNSPTWDITIPPYPLASRSSCSDTCNTHFGCRSHKEELSKKFGFNVHSPSGCFAKQNYLDQCVLPAASQDPCPTI
ncbi:hypothetical protein VTO42DRAFT_614 [Malbranchea cinnamomea]